MRVAPGLATVTTKSESRPAVASDPPTTREDQLPGLPEAPGAGEVSGSAGRGIAADESAATAYGQARDGKRSPGVLDGIPRSPTSSPDVFARGACSEEKTPAHQAGDRRGDPRGWGDFCAARHGS